VPGSHVCAIYETNEDHRAILTPILTDGFSNNEKVLYITDTNHPVDIINSIADTEIDAKHYLRNGQFTITTSADIQMRAIDYDSEKIFRFFRDALDKAKKDKYSALRIISEMTCVMLGPPGLERLKSYETIIGKLTSGGRCFAVCMFDKRLFLSELLIEALKIHPYAIIGKTLCNNFFYIPPKERIPGNAALTELNHSMKMLLLCNKVKPIGGKEGGYTQ